MALCASILRHMDPRTLSAAVQLHLEDTEELASRVKGKGREGTISDAELALQMYIEELNACSANLSDRKMAQSMALAVIRDAQIIHQENLKEQSAIRDRELAASLEAENDGLPQMAHTEGRTNDEHFDIWQDPEMLSKAAAIYMSIPEEEESSSLSLPPLLFESDYDEGPEKPVAESSKWAAMTKTKQKPMKGRCVACGDEKEFFEVARVPCKNAHEYCRECLAQLFQLSMTDETLFPPRCCSEPIPLQRVRFFLPPDLAKEFEAKEPELSTKNRTYCHDRICSTFIPVHAIENDIASCPRCHRTTCTMCKQPSHSGDCPQDTALQQLLDTANAAQWQRCYQCTRIVELDHGCNHMTCPCGAQFCYVCGRQWYTCSCPQWDEQRLETRAAQIANRVPNPRRALFQPPRVAHRQPQARASTIAPTAAVDVVVSPESSAWESDWSDHSVWESEWGFSDYEDELPNVPILDLLMPRAQSLPIAAPVAAAPTTGSAEHRNQRIADAMQLLRESHECHHDNWRWVTGPHCCEECHHHLKKYIFECRQCRLQACNRCRRNRL